MPLSSVCSTAAFESIRKRKGRLSRDDKNARMKRNPHESFNLQKFMRFTSQETLEFVVAFNRKLEHEVLLFSS